MSVNDDLLCVCSDKDVYSSDSVQSDILTVDHSKNFHCILRYDNLFFEDLCFNESKERLSNTSGQTPTENVFHHIVSQSNGNIFAPDDDLESRPRVTTISNDTNDNDMNRFEASNTISEIRIKNLNNIIIGHLNVNSLPNKFDSLTSIIKNYIDIIVLTETKLDDSYPTSQFTIEGYSTPFRHDRNTDGGGILIYSREDIPCREHSCHSFSEGIEGIFIELNFRKRKWMLLGTYHPPSQKHDYYFENLSNALNMYISEYDNILLTGDFNTNESHVAMKNF